MSQQKKLCVGVVGCGVLGGHHARLYSGMKDVELAGVYDAVPGNAENLAKRFGARAFADINSLLEKVEAVTVATPATTHVEVGSQILEKGIHVLMEKPIAHKSSEAEKLVRLAKEKNVLLCVGHVERFNPAFRRLLVEAPAPRFLEIHRLAAFGARGIDVDVVLDLMIHDIDLVFQTVNSPLMSVEASGVTVVSPSFDIANARLLFENGCAANLTASRISNKKMRKFRLFQQGAYFSLDLSEPSIEIYRMDSTGKKDEVKVMEGGLGVCYTHPELPETNALEEEIAAFLDSVRKGSAQNSIASGIEGLQALQVAETIRQRCQ